MYGNRDAELGGVWAGTPWIENTSAPRKRPYQNSRGHKLDEPLIEKI
jgi:hypothetical protein